MQARLVSVWSRPCASANDYHGYPATRVIEKNLASRRFGGWTRFPRHWVAWVTSWWFSSRSFSPTR